MTTGQLIYYRDLLWVLVAKEFKIRYKSTLLGYAWSALNPLAFALVFFLVFRVVMRLEMENYALVLITGLFPWQWFSNSVVAANGFLLGNGTLIRKVRFPRQFLVLAGVLNDKVHFLISIPIILGFMLYHGLHPSWTWLWAVPALAALQLALTYGAALIVSTVNLFFRDCERLTGVAMMLWFYLTPVIYPVKMIPEKYRALLYVNPMAGLIVSWRTLFMEGTVPPDMLLSAAGWAAALWLAGSLVFRSAEGRFAEVV